MTKFGDRLIAAAREARAIARGEADPSTYRVHMIQEVDVREVRKSMKMSQPEFAEAFAIPVGTLRDRAQKRRQPEGPAKVLLNVIKHEPSAVKRALVAAQPHVADPGGASKR